MNYKQFLREEHRRTAKEISEPEKPVEFWWQKKDTEQLKCYKLTVEKLYEKYR